MQRILVLSGIFGVLTFGILFCKLWQLQVVQHEKLENKAITQQTREISSTANRGTIYDANGDILAISGSVQNVILSPRDVLATVKVDEKDEFGNARSETAIEAEKETKVQATYDLIADEMSEILGLDREDVMARLKKTKSAYEVLAEKVEDDVADQIRAFIDENDLEGCLYLTADSKRYYPYSTMASQVIGFVNKANEGAYGLEALYNLDLAGQDGKIITAKNASGTEMPSAYSSYTDAVDGYNVHTTIDATIQMYAEKTLEEGIQKFDVTNGGFCLVMDPDTGAVLAMASSPDYDLNDPNSIVDATQAAKLEELKNDPTVSEEEYAKALSDAQLQQWANKNMRLSYEPGSTFKPVVVAAALEEGVIDDNSTFYCRGAVTIDNWTIRCSARSGHGSQSLRKAVMNSCNPALIDIGKKLGAEKFYEYWENFGFTSKTGIELPSEEKSTFWDKELFVSPSGVTQLATASFGQRFTTTPIHLITALSAVINGGHLLEPYLVQSVTDAEGNVVSYHEPKEVRQVIIQDYGLTQEEAAHRVSKSRPAVANAMRLLSLPQEVQWLIEQGNLSAGHGRALLSLPAPEEQIQFAGEIMEKGYSVRETEERIRQRLQAQDQPAQARPAPSPLRLYYKEAERQLTAGLGRRVTITQGKKKGKIALEYYDQEDLEGLMQALSALDTGKERRKP